MPETLLGFDFGTRRIGIAIGQTLTGSARPLTTLNTRNGKPDWEAIGRLIREWQPDRLIVGLPLHMDGTPQPMPVDWVDERLTSDAAERELPSQRDKGAVDALAAALILEDWLAQHA